MADSRDILGKNRKFKGTSGVVMPKGSTAERADTESGEIRFNTTTELMEYYDGNQWKPIDAPPTISSVSTNDATGSSTVLNADGSTIYTITITGGNFGIGANVKFIGNTGTEYTAGNINRVSGSSITCTTLSNMGTSDDPYDVQVINASGLSALFEDAFSYNAPPAFDTPSGQLGTVYNGQIISGSTFDASATDAEGNTITYSIISGSLPGSGLSLSSSTGLITGTLSGTPSLGNYPFVVQAATTEGNVERQFSIQVIATPPVEAEWLVVAGGGAGGYTDTGWVGGGGGSGGIAYHSGVSMTEGDVFTITVGAGANGPDNDTEMGTDNVADNGGNSSIVASGYTTVLAYGGGGGAGYVTAYTKGSDGGSGGGGEGNNNSTQSSATQGTGGTTLYGNAGGSGTNGSPYDGGGGGGAGGAGSNDRTGGVGTSDFSAWGAATSTGENVGGTYYYAGGGGGGSQSSTGGTGGNGGGGDGGSVGGTSGTNGTDGTGGGGGGRGQYNAGSGVGGDGGDGVVIIRYTDANGQRSTGGTVVQSGGYYYHTFTSSGSFTA